MTTNDHNLVLIASILDLHCHELVAFIIHFCLHTWRAGTTVEGAHGIQALHHGSGGAATIIGRAFIYILTAVAISLPS